MSLLTFMLYVGDKAQAQQGGWRVPEATLHFGGKFAPYVLLPVIPNK